MLYNKDVDHFHFYAILSLITSRYAINIIVSNNTINGGPSVTNVSRNIYWTIIIASYSYNSYPSPEILKESQPDTPAKIPEDVFEAKLSNVFPAFRNI